VTFEDGVAGEVLDPKLIGDVRRGQARVAEHRSAIDVVDDAIDLDRSAKGGSVHDADGFTAKLSLPYARGERARTKSSSSSSASHRPDGASAPQRSLIDDRAGVTGRLRYLSGPSFPDMRRRRPLKPSGRAGGHGSLGRDKGRLVSGLVSVVWGAQELQVDWIVDRRRRPTNGR
jgi:hypothetical protein